MPCLASPSTMWERLPQPLVVHRHAHQFRSGACQRGAPVDGAGDVGGIGIGHRLHHDWCIAAHAYSADQAGDGFSTVNVSH